MKLEICNRPAEDQVVIVRETAARRRVLPVMVETDFWVSWVLAVLFGHPLRQLRACFVRKRPRYL